MTSHFQDGGHDIRPSLTARCLRYSPRIIMHLLQMYNFFALPNDIAKF